MSVESPLLKRLRRKHNRLRARANDLGDQADEVGEAIDKEHRRLNPPGPMAISFEEEFTRNILEVFNAHTDFDQIFAPSDAEKFRRNHARTFGAKT